MAGAMFIIGWNLVWTSLILLFIKHVLRIPLRMSEEQLLEGDDAIHGEAAYTFGPCEAHEHGGYIQGHPLGPHTATNSGELGLGGGHHEHLHDSDEAEKAVKRNNATDI